MGDGRQVLMAAPAQQGGREKKRRILDQNHVAWQNPTNPKLRDPV